MKYVEALSVIIFVSGIIIAIWRRNWRYFVVFLSVALTITLWVSPQYPINQKISMSVVFLVAGGYCLVSSILKEINYKKSEYYKQTGKELYEVKNTKGGYGEYLLSEQLQPLESNKYKTLYNVYIPKQDGTTTEIDTLCITHVGIIVAESKNYSGWIFGNATQNNWTQVIYKERSQFYNPVLQNKGHIRELSKFIEIPEEEMISVIIFSERCELKKVPENIGGSLYIIKRSKFNDTLNDIYEKRDVIFDDNQVNSIYQKLIHFTKQSVEVKQKHINDIRQHTKDKRNVY